MEIPAVLYKYSTAQTTLAVLRTITLRWASPFIFNDLAEFQRMPRFSPSVADSYPIFAEMIVGAAFGGTQLDESALSKNTQQLLQNVKLLAKAGKSRRDLTAMLSGGVENVDEKVESALRSFMESTEPRTARILCVTTAYDNDAMWGNYSESHFGCVLGFRHLPDRSTPLLAARPVTYTGERPVIGSGVDFLLFGGTSELNRRTLTAICTSKKEIWSYEREWRAITWRPEERGSDYGDYSFYPEELESVTLGARTVPEIESAVRAAISSKFPSTAIYRIEMVAGELTRKQI